MSGPDDEEIIDGGEPEAEAGEEVTAGADEGESLEATGEGADAEGDDEGQVEEPARKPNRAQSRIQTLTRTLAEEKAERQRIDRELADLRAEQRARQAQAQQETPEARATRRALMDPMEVMREDLRESEARTQNLLHQQAMQTQEANDKMLYNNILREQPNLKKFEAEVEKVRKEQADRGVFVPREVLLDLAIGRAARAAAAKAAPKAKAAGAARVAAQQTKPAAASSNTATQRGKQGDSPEKRLENVPI